MDDIFGNGSSAEVFSPCNGLFLHQTIEHALDKGWLAIVPNVYLELINPVQPMDDLVERQERIKSWERQHIKDYKIIALDKQHHMVTTTQFITDNVDKLLNLHGRKLVFRTNFRPSARYVWWTFLAAILKTGWRQKGSSESNVMTQEVQQANRYWGTRGRYVKKNMLLGFVEELGQDVESILENAIDEESEVEPSLEGVAVVAEDVIIKTRADETDDEEEEEDDDDVDSKDKNAKEWN